MCSGVISHASLKLEFVRDALDIFLRSLSQWGGMGLCSSVVWSANTAGHARIRLYGQAAVAAVLDREGGFEEIGSLE